TVDKPAESSPRSLKKRKIGGKHVSKEPEGADHDCATWIQSAWLELSAQTGAHLCFQSMTGDDFYGTCVVPQPEERAALDLVELQPMLKMLHAGFHGGNVLTEDDDLASFEILQLEKSFSHDSSLSVDLGDLYETFVVNDGQTAVVVSLTSEKSPLYLIPPHSGFIVSDFSQIYRLKSIAQTRGPFDMIVMDPPWQNASVDRMSHYGTMDLYDLFKIPIQELLSKNGVVAVWITNRAKVKRVVIEKLFPAWGLMHVAHWFWLKVNIVQVTTHGDPVLSLDGDHRKPYEGILIGKRVSYCKPSYASASSPKDPPLFMKKLLVSVPSQHSRKPSISRLLEQEFLSESCDASGHEPRRLELFARNLEEGFVSWGNEPIKYQYCGQRSSSEKPDVQDGFLVPDATQ
ncbi:Methyltransferase-like protein 4, partial [Podila humilis]